MKFYIYYEDDGLNGVRGKSVKSDTPCRELYKFEGSEEDLTIIAKKIIKNKCHRRSGGITIFVDNKKGSEETGYQCVKDVKEFL